jgi:hypothetical protein
MEHFFSSWKSPQEPPSKEIFKNDVELHIGSFGSQYQFDFEKSPDKALKDAVEKYRQSQNSEVIGATCHYKYEYLLALWPNSKYIYLERDPRDVSLSIVKQGWIAHPYLAAQKWKQAHSEWNLFKSKIDPSRYIEIKYENLVSEPQIEVSKICSFMGLRYEPDMLNYWKNTTYSKVDPNQKFIWKNHSKKRDIQYIESYLWDILQHGEYSLSGFSQIKVTRFKKKFIKISERWRRAATRLHKLGLFFWLIDILKNRIPLPKATRHKLSIFVRNRWLVLRK